jgi:alpha-ketoglutarate-dependent 2,4-dichlorophenoxyacetate dioxygenase
MALTFTPLHPLFAAEAGTVDLRTADASTLEEIRRGMDRYAVLVFRDQPFSDDEQLSFAQRLDGTLHAKTSSSVVARSRLGNEALTDISNVGGDGELLAASDRRRMNGLANRLWHTDASFVDPPGRYSMLSARVVPPVRADTLFADTRSAYDELDESTKALVQDLRVHHSIAYSRQVLGFEFSPEERAQLQGAEQPLVRTVAGRRALYLASHAERIVGWPLPEGRLLLRELMEHATQPRYVYSHEWRVGDLVIWDNRTTMHRGTSFDDSRHRREMRRTTTLDIERPPAAPLTGAATPARTS